MKTVTQIAKELNLTRSVIHYHIYRGHLKAELVGKQYVISDKEFERFRKERDDK